MNFLIAQYVEINIIGIIVLMLMLFFIVRTHRTVESADQMLFTRLLISNAVILATDIAIYLMPGYTAAHMISINHVMCVIYYLLHAYFGYVWLSYCMRRLYPEYVPGNILKIIIALPCIVSTVIAVCSPWTEWVYYITGNNQYMRGPLMWTVIVFSYSYWAVSAVAVVREMIKQQRNREKSLYYTLLFFPIPTIIVNIVQLKYYGLSIIWISSAVSLLIIFIDLLNVQLLRDTLTGLYNRRYTNNQLAWEVSHISPDYKLYVVMIDVDNFKKINDKFGHVVGDRALITIAEILKKCVGANAFLGRFGGDEFIIIGHTSGNDEVESLLKRIDDAMDYHNMHSLCPYKLSLSAGYAIYDSGDDITVDKVISAADSEMYKIKENREHK